MNDKWLELINMLFKNIFKKDNTFSLKEIKKKFAFDIKLPIKVLDTTTNEETWTSYYNAECFITQKNMENMDVTKGWMQPKRDVNSLDDLIKLWQQINLTTTERVYESENVEKSDTIYNSINVYQSSDSINCQNIIFCDSCRNCEYSLACQRSGFLTFCIRCDDSKNCSNSYNVICSNKVSNSLFIQDSFDLDECIFCSHIAGKKYCIANMQFEKEEYFEIKKIIIDWLLNS